MVFAVGSKYEGGFVSETIFGTTPASPALRKLRITGDEIKLAKGNYLSAELRSDREIADFRHGNRQVSGNIKFELSKETGFESWLLNLLEASAWSPITKTRNTYSFAGQVISDSSANFIADGFKLGDIVAVTGSASNNVVARTITALTAGAMTISGAALTTEAAGASDTITMGRKYAVVGVAPSSFSYERRFMDVGVYQLVSGLRVNTFSLTVKPEAIVTGEFGIMAANLITSATSVDAVADPADGNSVMDSYTGTIMENGVVIGVVTGVDFSVNNNLSPANVVGSNKLAQILDERCNTSGTLTLWLQDSTILSKFENETITSLNLQIGDAAGNYYTFIMPQMKYGDASTPVSGFGGITVSMPFQAYRNPTLGYSLRIEKSS